MKKFTLHFLTLVIIAISLMSNVYSDLVLSFNDTRGDDNGGGNLAYPERFDIQRGDLDLLKFEINSTSNGLWFEVKFLKPIRDPSQARTSVGPESLSNFYRKGFFAFNIDIYIDKDRIKNSGNSFTLPGRHAQIAAEHAWEKAIILSPRPEFISGIFFAALSKVFKNLESEEIRNTIDKRIFFPKRVHVKNRVIEFFVPSSMLGQGNPADWAYTLFVTGAKTSQVLKFSRSGKGLKALELGVMQPKVGRPMQTFGLENDRLKTLPIIDLLTESGDQQQLILKSGGSAKLQAVSVTEALPGSSEKKLTLSINEWFEHLPEQSKLVQPTVKPVVSKKTLKKKITSLNPQPVIKLQQSAILQIKARLDRLDLLLQEKVITQQEHQSQRKRILDEL